jgi:hemolysin activation/secretion protein
VHAKGDDNVLFVKRRPSAVAASVLIAIGLFSSFSVFAQSPDAGTIQRETEQGLPAIKRPTPLLPQTVPEEVKKPVTGPEASAQRLPSAIKIIEVQSPIFKKGIEALLRDRFLDKTSVSAAEIDDARNAIWSLYRANKRLAHVELNVIAGVDAAGGSKVQAQVTEMRVRKVIVQQEGAGTIGQSLMDRIQRAAAAQFSDNAVLDLGHLDARLKRRLFLGDINLRASVEPVDPEHIDLKILVSQKAHEPFAFLAQYDNTGSWTFGADRFTGGVSKSSLLLDGDKLDVMGLKTMDIGGLDARGMYYGRVSYEIPVVPLGARLSVWSSGLHYQALSGLTASSNATGQSLEAGTGVYRPMYIGSAFSAMGHVEYVEKWEKDFLLTQVVSADKESHNGRVKVDLDYALAPTQALGANLGATVGSIDLSGDPGALAQDQKGPRVNGTFAKFEGDGKWLGRWGSAQKIDTRLEAKGQYANKNLDSMEKFSLGGPSGLRAFSVSEAAGDAGYIVNAEMGYAVLPWLRAATFYDVGGITRIRNPYAVDKIPNRYVLQDAGGSLSATFFKSLDANLSFAHEIGHNPGLQADGNDADNTRQRYRVFGTLTYRF